ncbi:hypothetical protein BGP77_13965 [Saccharospirillum sp. MSK14-1]|uniref:restriction endonuclease subunit S n=1 Tax=Saccharospirillum sp. MSK14-1 TaxID=1897632 RepID=UPI000D3BB614|nr:restriction endonuclease subunit S [Saccharospirillum sp. MSK14-1]PTY37595.1 hypothetical protein BGP77_13965 [Saccharospirillum sp. MSK14-1]
MSLAIAIKHCRLKYLAQLNMGQSPPSEAVTRFDEGDGLPFLQGNAEFGAVSPSYKHTCNNPPKAAMNGDLLVSVRAPVGALNIADQPYGIGRGLCAVKWINIEPRFGWWAMHHHRAKLKEVATGSTYEAVSAEDLGNLVLSFPDEQSQCFISNYLDRETSRIDGLIAEKQHMLALLEEKRAVLISQIVTRGLDPNIPFKPSGLEWLGEIPAHWEEPRAKGLFQEVDKRTKTGKETLLSLRMGKGLVPHHEVSEKPLEASDVIGFKKIEPGQMVINRMRAASGLIAVATESGLVSPDYAVFEVVDRELSIEYFLELFKTSLLQAVFRSSSKGLGTGEQGFLRLYTEAFLSFHFPYPPVEEQLTIVKFIQRQRSEMLHMENLLRHSIDLAKERRTALITDAVTGQIPLKDMAE